VSVEAFYDGLAPHYHLVYEDWEGAVERQGAALDALLRAFCGDRELEILDCACGIGTQALGLAAHGHRVTGSDISAAALERAGVEAAGRGLDIRFLRADFRELAIDGDFDAVLAFDNALPHLLDPADLPRALHAMHARIRPGGLLVTSIRDYDEALRERPRLAAQELPGPPRRVVVRLHEWDDDAPTYTARFLVAVEEEQGWTLHEHATRYRAVTRRELEGALAATGYTDLRWHDGFHQPVVTARS